MRVKFTRDHAGHPGSNSYVKGQVIDLDDGEAEVLIVTGAAKAFPRSRAELDEAASKYVAGDDHRTPQQIAGRTPQIVALSGDTRANTEAQLGEDDPHVARQDAMDAAAKASEKAAAERAKDEKAADAERAKAPVGGTVQDVSSTRKP